MQDIYQFKYFPNRICIPFGLKCNFQCKYCYRDIQRLELPSDLSEAMKCYLQQVSPSWCESVLASGGEPLIYFNKIKEVFAHVPKDVHKCIMTNGSLLTQEIVNYINSNDIELHLSYDGAMTEFLRGVDVLNNERLLNLIRQVRTLMIFSVVTKYNTDIKANYEYTVNKLGREDFIYKTNAVFQTPTNKALIDGFDYDEFARTFNYYVFNILEYSPHYQNVDIKDPHLRTLGCNIDLHGNVIGMATMNKYGTIFDDRDTLIKRQLELDLDSGFCRSQNCLYRDRCMQQRPLASEHSCRIEKITGEIYNEFD